MSRVKVPLFGKPETEQFGIPTDLPDIVFTRKLSIQGRMRYIQGLIATTGTIVEFIPAEGETFFYLSSSIQYRSSDALNVAAIEIQNDGQIRFSGTFFASLNPSNQPFFIDSLVGNGSKSFRIECTANAGSRNVEASLIGWVENTSRIRDVTI